MWRADSSTLRGVWLLGLALLGILWATTGPAAAQGAPDPRFGAVEAFWAPEQARDAGLGWERILFYWREIQPTGPSDWNTLHVWDEWLAEAQVAGREVVGVLKQTPRWATDGRPDSGVPRGLYLPVQHPDNLWAGYVRRVARYYGPRGVHHWIIWNEPDIAPGVFGFEFAGSVADYYRLLKVAAIVLRAEDPDAVVHLAGLTYWHDVEAGREQYLSRFLKVAAADPGAKARGYYFDVISLHIYFRSESVPAIVEEMQAILAEYGLEKPIWINETNAAPDQDPSWPVRRPDFPVDLEQQAWYLVQAHVMGFAAGVERVGVYKFTDVLVAPGDEPYGLLRADFSERPAYATYRQMTQLLGGFSAVEPIVHEAYRGARFLVPGARVTVLWARTAEGLAVHVPAAGAEARLITWEGEVRDLRPAGRAYVLILRGARCAPECLMGGPPVFLVEADESVVLEEPAGLPTVAVTPRATAVIGPVPAPTAAVVASEDSPGSGPAYVGTWASGSEGVRGAGVEGMREEGAAGSRRGVGVGAVLLGVGLTGGMALGGWWWRARRRG